MKRWFWSHRKGMQYAWFILGGIIMIAFEITWIFRNRPGSYQKIMLPLMIFYTVWVAAGIFFFVLASHRRSAQALHAFDRDCDPEPLLRWAEEETAYWGNHLHNRAGRNLFAVGRINEAAALSSMGRYYEALSILQSLDLKDMTPLFRIIHYTNLACFFTNSEQASQAEAALAQAQFLFQLDPPKKQADMIQDSLTSCRLSLSILHRKTEGIEEELIALLESKSTERCIVCRRFALAQLYLLENRPQEAREQLEYVLAHGNKLYIRAQAQELLDSLSQ